MSIRLKYLLVLGLLLVCDNPFANAQQGALPRYHQAFTICTHNSYWIKRSHQADLYATGTQERLLDQLLFDKARAIEIDIHMDPRRPGKWRVYHTTKAKNVFFDRFEDCLRQLQQFHYAHPTHHPVTVVLELKGILKQNWDKEHQPADLDRVLEEYLGPELFRPYDLMNRCPGAADLSECVARNDTAWPTLRELQGKFIFLVLGNFHHGAIGHGGLGWATYAASENPAAFPMQSDFSHFNGNGKNAEKVPAALLERAYRQSVFMQVENLTDTLHLAAVHRFLQEGGIVRGGTAFTQSEQASRIASGFQFLQSDYPWSRLVIPGFGGAYQPIDTLQFPDSTAFAEAWSPVWEVNYDSTSDETYSKASFSDWEALPSVTRISPDPAFPNPSKPRGKGCLRAAADAENQVCICRTVDKRQNALVTVDVVRDGERRTQRFSSDDNGIGKVGDMIRMTVDISPVDSFTVVEFYSAAEVLRNAEGSFTPNWNYLGQATFPLPLHWQGLYTKRADVVYFGTKWSGEE